MNQNPIYKTTAGEQAVMSHYDTLLAQWPIPNETFYVPTRHGETFVVAGGNPAAPPLALLHGAGTNSAIWLGEAAVYGRTHRLYAIDLLGEAGKSAPRRLDWSGPIYAEWLADVLDALEIETTALMGISLGGWTAVKFTLTQPDRVSKLALLCPGGIVPASGSFALRALFFSLLGKWGRQRLTQLLFGDQLLPEGTEETAALINAHYKHRVGALPLFSDEELARLTMPTLLVGGEKDALFDMEAMAARLRPLLPRLTIHIIPGAGHALVNTTHLTAPFLGAPQPV